MWVGAFRVIGFEKLNFSVPESNSRTPALLGFVAHQARGATRLESLPHA